MCIFNALGAPGMSFISLYLCYLFLMKPRRKIVCNPVSAAASTVPITSGQGAGLSPAFKPTQDRPGSFTSIEGCGLSVPAEISDSDVEALLDFFMTLDRWDREAGGETVSGSTWERFQ